MDDILHILDLLRERAEADLVGLTTQRAAFLAQISQVKHDTASTAVRSPNIEDQHVWENWHYSQISRIKAIEKKIAPLDEDIGKAKMHYKTILAKHLAAQETVELAVRDAQIRTEENEGDEQLEVFRQNKKA